MENTKLKDNEIFIDIPGYEGIYQISTLGRIKSLERLKSRGVNRKGMRIQKEKILKIRTYSNGYELVTLCKDSKRKTYSIHKLMQMTFKDNFTLNLPCIDHINRIRNDNRLENLRECTYQQNMMNTLPIKNCISKYKGVTFSKAHNKWRSSHMIDGKTKHIKYSDSEIECAIAYDNTVKAIYGDIAYLNFPNGEYNDISIKS